MGIQTIIICVLFLGAVYYIGKSIFSSLNSKKGCASNCKCSVDFSKVKPNED